MMIMYWMVCCCLAFESGGTRVQRNIWKFTCRWQPYKGWLCLWKSEVTRCIQRLSVEETWTLMNQTRVSSLFITRITKIMCLLAGNWIDLKVEFSSPSNSDQSPVVYFDFASGRHLTRFWSSSFVKVEA